MLTVAFTGYRPEKMPFSEDRQNENYLKFRKVLLHVIKRLTEHGYTSFISGAAQGFDTWAAEDVLELKAENAELVLECAIPFPEQAKSWPLSEQTRRAEILSRADCLFTVSNRFTRSCFFTRNRYMVDKADAVVCAYNGQKGGTDYTVKYALKQNKTVIQIDPATCEVTVIGKG